jgi:hypothetical protein
MSGITDPLPIGQVGSVRSYNERFQRVGEAFPELLKGYPHVCTRVKLRWNTGCQCLTSHPMESTIRLGAKRRVGTVGAPASDMSAQ